MEKQEMRPKVAISILNWMQYEDTIACIRGIQSLTFDNMLLLVRDNASPNDSFSKLQEAFPMLHISQSTSNEGYAAGHYANYLLAKEAKADLFWILNSDLEVDENALNQMVTCYYENGEAIYGSVSLDPNNPLLIDFGGAALSEKSSKELTYNSWKGKSYQELITLYPKFYEVEAVEGSSLMIPMSVIEKHGFMELDYFMYGEETDYCYRMRSKRIPSIVVSTSIVKHHNQGSFKASEKLKIVPAYYRRRNALRFSIKHLGLSRFQALGYQNGLWQNIKTILAGWLKGKKDLNYFYALACYHAFLGKKGKTIAPEKILTLK